MAAEGESIGPFVSELMSEYRERSESVMTNFRDQLVEEFEGPDDIVRSFFPVQVWREMYYGTLPPTRQIDLIYRHGDPWDRDLDLIMALSKQIADEHAHSKIFAHSYEQVVGEPLDLANYTPPNVDDIIKLGRYFVEWEKPQYSAMAFQCSVEITAAIIAGHLADAVEPEYPRIAETMQENIVSDEADHIHAGRMVVTRFATPDEREKLEEIAETGWRLRKELTGGRY